MSDRRQQQRDEVVTEEYQVEIEQRNADGRSPLHQRQTSTIDTRHQHRDETSEEDVSDPYVTTGGSYHGLSTIVDEAGRRRDSDWRKKLSEVYTSTTDDDRFDQVQKKVFFYSLVRI